MALFTRLAIRASRLFSFPLALVFVLALAAAAPSEERFRQILTLVGDGNGDGFIDEDELADFLKRNRDKAAQRLAEFGLTVSDAGKFEQYLEGVAIEVSNAVHRNRRNPGIDAKELTSLEDFELRPPLSGLFGEVFLPEEVRVAPQVVEGRRKSAKLGDWIRVRQSVLDSSAVARPATLTWSHRGGEDETLAPGQDRTIFGFQGSVSLEPRTWRGENYVLSPLAALEADLASDQPAEMDQIVHRAGIGGGFYSKKPSQDLSGHNFIATFDVVADRDYDLKSVGGTLQYTPDVLGIGIGRYLPDGGTAAAAFRWRPYVGLVFADVADGFESADFADFANFYFKAAGELSLAGRLLVVPEVTFFQELRNAKEGHAFFGAGIRYLLDRSGRFSLEWSYARGEKAPEFFEQELTRLSLGVKF